MNTFKIFLVVASLASLSLAHPVDPVSGALSAATGILGGFTGFLGNSGTGMIQHAEENKASGARPDLLATVPKVATGAVGWVGEFAGDFLNWAGKTTGELTNGVQGAVGSLASGDVGGALDSLGTSLDVVGSISTLAGNAFGDKSAIILLNPAGDLVGATAGNDASLAVAKIVGGALGGLNG